MARARELLAVGLLLLVSLVVLSFQISKPFVGHHDWNSNLWTITAKNNLTYGIGCTRLGQAIDSASITDCRHLSYYTSHPPLVTWLVTLSYALGSGYSEWLGRLPIIISSLLTVLGIYALGRWWRGHLVGIGAGLLLLSTPMFAYFGKAINHEPLVLTGVVWAAYGLVRYLNGGQRRYWWLSVISTIWIGLSGWQGYIWIGLVWLVTWFKFRDKFKAMTGLVLLLVGIFTALTLYSCTALDSCPVLLLERLPERIMGGGADTTQAEIISFTYPKFFRQQLSWLRVYFGEGLLIATLVMTLITIAGIKRQKSVGKDGWIVLLLIFGALVPLIFAQQAYIHDYINFYLSAGIALLSAGMVHSLARGRQSLTAILIVTLALLTIFRTGEFNLALQNSRGNAQYVELGQVLASRLESGQAVIIEANNFGNFAYPFLDNYAYGLSLTHRTDTLDSFLLDQETLEQNHQFLVTISTNPVDEELVSWLNDNYPHESWGEMATLYELSHTSAD